MSGINSENNIISSKDLIWLLNAFLKHWYLYLILISVFTFVGFFYNYKQKLLYNTKIEILLKKIFYIL